MLKSPIVFTKNIYTNLFEKIKSETELVYTQKPRVFYKKYVHQFVCVKLELQRIMGVYVVSSSLGIATKCEPPATPHTLTPDLTTYTSPIQCKRPNITHIIQQRCPNTKTHTHTNHKYKSTPHINHMLYLPKPSGPRLQACKSSVYLPCHPTNWFSPTLETKGHQVSTTTLLENHKNCF